MFPVKEDVLNEDKYYLENKEFIKKSIVFVNREWIFNFPPPDNEYPNIAWYEVTNKKEIMEAIAYDMMFSCIILKSRATTTIEAEYILNSYDDGEFNNLSIIDKSKGNFFSKILPKLKRHFEENLEIVYL